MRRDQVLPILAVILFGISLIMIANGVMFADIFTGGGFITLAVHRKTFYKRGIISVIIPNVLLALGVYFVVVGVWNIF